jgi:hypothetical protein
MVDNTSADKRDCQIRDETGALYMVNGHVQRFATTPQATQFAKRLTTKDGLARTVEPFGSEVDGEA